MANDPEVATDRAQALEELRSYAAVLLDVVREHPEPSLERDEAQWRMEELVEELDRTPPSAPRVKSRWLRLAPVLGEVRPDVPIQRLDELINAAV
ncbi:MULTISPECIES: hypothetical protein [Saccharopolyspora]|uniref:Uncharacterized protein n=1 Tax=Saccharopolyspora cebuensis TaxID=418759 RepID=A0ABV4CL13_9PSEU